MNQTTINIGGKDRIINFGLKSVSEIVDHNDWGFATLGRKMQNNSLATTPVIIYYGAKNGVESVGGTVDFTLNDVYTWVQDKGLNNKELISAISLFGTSVSAFVKDLQGENDENENIEEPKKK